MATAGVDADFGQAEDGVAHHLLASNSDSRHLWQEMPQIFATPSRQQRRGVAVGLAISIMLAMAITVIATSTTHRSHDITTGQTNSLPSSTVDLYATNGVDDIAEELKPTTKLAMKMRETVQSGAHNLAKMMHTPNRSFGWFGRMSAETLANMRTKFQKHDNTGLSASALKHVVDTASMNASQGFCSDDEELLGNLCYKKCSLLTDNQYPIRTTAFSCCRNKPCGFSNQKLNIRICGGYDVSGKNMGGGCPHFFGSCFDNEEVHLGLCYKKCSILTGFAYPFRTGAGTCCTVGSKISCMNPFNTLTKKKFIVGGGYSDGDPNTPEKPHLPIFSIQT